MRKLYDERFLNIGILLIERAVKKYNLNLMHRFLVWTNFAFKMELITLIYSKPRWSCDRILGHYGICGYKVKLFQRLNWKGGAIRILYYMDTIL